MQPDKGKAWPLGDAEEKTRAMLVDGTQLPQTNPRRGKKAQAPHAQRFAAARGALHQHHSVVGATDRPLAVGQRPQRKDAVGSSSRY